MSSDLEVILNRWSIGEVSFPDAREALDQLETDVVHTPSEVTALLKALEFLISQIQAYQYPDEAYDSPLNVMAGLLQNMNLEALEQPDGDYFDDVYTCINRLADYCETFLGQNFEDERGLPFACKVLALWRHPRNPRFMAQIATDVRHNDNYLWEVTFKVYSRCKPEVQLAVVESLRDPLPRQFMGVAYLDFVNQLAIANTVTQHPFDTLEGKARLRSWLSDPDLDNASYAQSATVSLPFISEPERSELLALAQEFNSPLVQIETAWTMAKLGDERGIEKLQEFAANPNYAERAQSYLQEFGVEAAVLPPDDNPDFWAQAEMANWLAHPQEFGRPPDQLELCDTRILDWPPTGDERQVWLFKYTYDQDQDQPRVGYGMVGSITFALRGKNANLSPEDVYALHCGWELMINQDPRAPAKGTIEAGRELLRRSNPGFNKRSWLHSFVARFSYCFAHYLG
jgi:hypothetical protein